MGGWYTRCNGSTGKLGSQDGVPLPKTSPSGGGEGGECASGKSWTGEVWSSRVENLQAAVKRLPCAPMGLLQRRKVVFGWMLLQVPQRKVLYRQTGKL